jgi:hypothetical protein
VQQSPTARGCRILVNCVLPLTLTVDIDYGEENQQNCSDSEIKNSSQNNHAELL